VLDSSEFGKDGVQMSKDTGKKLKASIYRC